MIVKIRRKIKLIRTMPPQEKAKWAGWVLITLFASLSYLKAMGMWP